MWRWLVAFGLTAIPVTIVFCVERLWLPTLRDMSPMPDEYLPGAVTLGWLKLMAIASPTILYYRLLIFAGERAVPHRPLTAVAILLLLGGIAPPLVQNWWAARSSLARDFTGPAPGRADIVVVEDRNGPSALVHCAQPCARLLFGGGARRVILAESGASPVAPALTLEQRPTCPPVSTHHDRARAAPGTPTMGLVWPEGETGDRALALIASGRCLVATRARLDDASLWLGKRGALQPRQVPVPDGFALVEGDYAFVDRRENGQWVRLSQRMGQSVVFRWLYPFAFLPSRQSAIAGLARYGYVSDGVPSNPQPWRWAGMVLPEVPDLGWQRIREMLRAAVALPAGAPRDARHQLARQYLAGLLNRPADAVDRDLLRRLPADPRIARGDLQDLGRAVAAVRDGPPPPRRDDAYGVRPAWQDLGYLGTRKYGAFAFDVAILLALNLALLAIALGISRARKRLQAADGPVQATP
jgi:hypothetical protein